MGMDPSESICSELINYMSYAPFTKSREEVAKLSPKFSNEIKRIKDKRIPVKLTNIRQRTNRKNLSLY